MARAGESVSLVFFPDFSTGMLLVDGTASSTEAWVEPPWVRVHRLLAKNAVNDPRINDPCPHPCVESTAVRLSSNAMRELHQIRARLNEVVHAPDAVDTVLENFSAKKAEVLSIKQVLGGIRGASVGTQQSVDFMRNMIQSSSYDKKELASSMVGQDWMMRFVESVSHRLSEFYDRLYILADELFVHGTASLPTIPIVVLAFTQERCLARLATVLPRVREGQEATVIPDQNKRCTSKPVENKLFCKAHLNPDKLRAGRVDQELPPELASKYQEYCHDYATIIPYEKGCEWHIACAVPIIIHPMAQLLNRALYFQEPDAFAGKSLTANAAEFINPYVICTHAMEHKKRIRTVREILSNKRSEKKFASVDSAKLNQLCDFLREHFALPLTAMEMLKRRLALQLLDSTKRVRVATVTPKTKASSAVVEQDIAQVPLVPAESATATAKRSTTRKRANSASDASDTEADTATNVNADNDENDTEGPMTEDDYAAMTREMRMNFSLMADLLRIGMPRVIDSSVIESLGQTCSFEQVMPETINTSVCRCVISGIGVDAIPIRNCYMIPIRMALTLFDLGKFYTAENVTIDDYCWVVYAISELTLPDLLQAHREYGASFFNYKLIGIVKRATRSILESSAASISLPPISSYNDSDGFILRLERETVDEIMEGDAYQRSGKFPPDAYVNCMQLIDREVIPARDRDFLWSKQTAVSSHGADASEDASESAKAAATSTTSIETAPKRRRRNAKDLASMTEEEKKAARLEDKRRREEEDARRYDMAVKAAIAATAEDVAYNVALTTDASMGSTPTSPAGSTCSSTTDISRRVANAIGRLTVAEQIMAERRRFKTDETLLPYIFNYQYHPKKLVFTPANDSCSKSAFMVY